MLPVLLGVSVCVSVSVSVSKCAACEVESAKVVCVVMRVVGVWLQWCVPVGGVGPSVHFNWSDLVASVRCWFHQWYYQCGFISAVSSVGSSVVLSVLVSSVVLSVLVS